MSIAINNYLANSIEDVNFEPIKQYGIPVALLTMPPPAPFRVNYLSSSNKRKSYVNYRNDDFEQNGGGENKDSYYLSDSTFDKMFSSVNLNKTKNKTIKKI